MAAAVRKTGNYNRRIQQTRDAVASHAYRINGTVIADQSYERLAVAVESQARYTTIKIFNRFHSCRRGAAVGGHEHEVLHSVGAIFFFVAFEKDDPFSIRRPLRTRATSAIIRCRQLFFSCAGLRVSYEQLRRGIAI